MILRRYYVITWDVTQNVISVTQNVISVIPGTGVVGLVGLRVGRVELVKLVDWVVLTGTTEKIIA